MQVADAQAVCSNPHQNVVQVNVSPWEGTDMVEHFRGRFTRNYETGALWILRDILE